jgi:hypothetical protein
MPKPRGDCGQTRFRRKVRPAPAYAPGESGVCVKQTGGAGQDVVTLFLSPTGAHLAKIVHGVSAQDSPLTVARPTAHGSATIGTTALTVRVKPMRGRELTWFREQCRIRGLELVQLHADGKPLRDLGGAYVMSVRGGDVEARWWLASQPCIIECVESAHS